MGALSRWAVRKPVLALVAWFIAMAGVIGVGTQFFEPERYVAQCSRADVGAPGEAEEHHDRAAGPVFRSD